jgi:hypothetical protein
MLVAEFGGATGNTYSMLGALSAGGTVWNNLILQPSGNVGIGTTTPTAKLEVAGSVRSVKIDTNGSIASKGDAGGWSMGHTYEGSAGTNRGGF